MKYSALKYSALKYSCGHGDYFFQDLRIDRARGTARRALSPAHTQGDLLAIGPGKVALLEAIAEQGSISAAARSLGMSYRRAWQLVDELNRALSTPATESGPGGASGGGSTLTPVGERIVALYRGVEARAHEACEGANPGIDRADEALKP